MMEKSCFNCGNGEVKGGDIAFCMINNRTLCVTKDYLSWTPKQKIETTNVRLPYLHKILHAKYDLAVDKNTDYGNSFDKIMDKLVEHNINPLQGLYIRLADKFNRFETLLFSDSQKVNDESIRDTLTDMSNYIDLFAAWEAGKDGK